MVRRYKILILFLIAFSVVSITSAHPGRTDKYGCHTCRTNCEKWGLSYGEYHCHKPKGLPQPKKEIKSRRLNKLYEPQSLGNDSSLNQLNIPNLSLPEPPRININIPPLQMPQLNIDIPSYSSPLKPGTYANPYVVEPDPLSGGYQIKPKFPFFDLNEPPFKPGSYSNPYIISPDPLSGGYQIKPRFPSFDFNESPFEPGSFGNPYIIRPDPFSGGYEIKPRFPSF